MVCDSSANYEAVPCLLTYQGFDLATAMPRTSLGY
jgi:hypothetical protein